jgi:uncharacterized protein (TIGR00730 family)
LEINKVANFGFRLNPAFHCLFSYDILFPVTTAHITKPKEEQTVAGLPENMNKIICVYSSSSSAIDPLYFEIAAKLGRAIAESGNTMLFGGGMNGLMGATAKAVHQYQGTVIGVIPEALNLKDVVYESCDELIVTKDMRTRKGIMDEKSDSFIALPGGYGTLEELLEIITLKQLKYHNKPIVILNVNGFFDPLLAQFQTIVDQKFARAEHQQLYFITDNVPAALTHIETYVPPVQTPKYRQ